MMAMAAVLALGLGAAEARQDDPRLDPLFARLRAAATVEEAGVAERAIWEIWLQSGDDTIDEMMNRGGYAMAAGDYQVALAAFNAVVEAAPDFAEGWNKRATLYWLMGNYDASVADIDRTLALEPRHFGALSGLAMIRASQNRPAAAIDALEKLLAIHPRSPGVRERLQRLEEKAGVKT